MDLHQVFQVLLVVCHPQGSVLVSLVFLLYINYLHVAIKHSKVHHFDDDDDDNFDDDDDELFFLCGIVDR